MKKHTLLLRLFSSYIVLILVGTFLTLLITLSIMEKFYFEESVRGLEARAKLVSEIISRSGLLRSKQLNALSKSLGDEIDTRITLVMENGVVVADSDEDPKTMDIHNDRPEILLALKEGFGVSLRSSFTLREEYLYFAMMGAWQNEPLVIRLSYPTRTLHSAIYSLKVNFVWLGLGIVFLVAALNWYLTRRLIVPIQIMEAGASRFARGKMKIKIPESNISEFESLGQSLNKMASQIHERIRIITQQKSEQLAILSSMVEGVIAIDAKSQLISVNRQAAKMFGFKSKPAIGLPYYEVIRHVDLINFVDSTLKKKKSQETKIEVFSPNELVLNVIGSRMPSKKGAAGGAVFVFTDLTHIQKLENVRSEFVANVSHELKTPITSIQGYIETLQDGAINDKENAPKFLEIVSKHAKRLGLIVDDLLELSRIEEIQESDSQPMEPLELNKLVHETVNPFCDAASQRSIKIDMELEAGIELPLNGKLFSHALGNLIDNAIKYSDCGTTITISSLKQKQKLILQVKDQGHGIESQHMARIFERFYRIDKGRSRQIGGTGLGLSIVKHIARVYQAEIEVESTPGEGSTFRMIFPLELSP